jgi:hypothetical protein
MEIWKDISGYEGEYQVSTYGRVRSLDREIEVIEKNRTYIRKLKGDLLNQNKYKSKSNFYYRVQLKNKGKKYFVHRLVALTFIENNDSNRIEVNHKDLNGLNNHIDNLEWNTPSENVKHGHYTRKYQIKPVSLIKDGVVYHFNSVNDAKRAGAAAIDRLLKGTQKTTNGWTLL